MQPKRITAQKAFIKHANTNYQQSTANVTPLHSPMREAGTNFTMGSDANEDFVSDLSTMEYALPDFVDPRVFRLIGASAANGGVNSARPAYETAKRAVDVTIALMLLLISSPLLLVIALLVKATSKGPVFFAHRRLGHNGRVFACLKFRTMIADAEERLKRDPELRRQFEEKFKLEDDPRITPLGNFLRRTSLDELPQLFHVLTGEMSLVGPRPIVESELNKYSIYAHKLLTVKPGLSGLWQVCGRSHTTYPQRVMMDMHYIDHRSLKLDARLLLLTASAVVRKSGAW